MSIINDALKKAEQEGRSKFPLLHPLKKLEISQNKYRYFKFTLPFIGILSIISLFFLFNSLSPKKIGVRKMGSGKNRPYSPILSKVIPARTTRVKAGLSLNGIVFSEEGSWAVINDRIVREGDIIGGAKLLNIEENSVELSLPHKKLILKLPE